MTGNRTEITAVAGAVLYAIDQRFKLGMPIEFYAGLVMLAVYFLRARTDRLKVTADAALTVAAGTRDQ